MADRIVIGTARNVEAEYGYCSGVKGDKFTLVHFYGDEVVTVEGFKTREAIQREADTEYAGVDRETLWIELD